MPKEHIGIMGGSFNPIHERHIEMALSAKNELKLDRILFLPTGNPPHKHEGLADAQDRFEMTRLAVFGLSGCTASRLEIDREGVIYTVDTLSRLQKQMPDAVFDYIIGEDTLLDLPNWRKPDKVFTLCRFAVCCRSSQDVKNLPIVRELEARGARFAFLSLGASPVSSTEIRDRLLRGEEPEHLSPQVMEYIRMMGLYGQAQSPAGASDFYPRLKAAMTDKRLVHSLLVAYTARRLARQNGMDENQAAMAGLLHDCAKCLPLSVMQHIAKENRLLLDKETLQSGNLLHGPVGAMLAQKEYGVADPNILSAIRCHTTGKVGMLPLDMIVYLADKIEPSRRSYPALEEVRELAGHDLAGAMLCSLESTLRYVKSQNATPHPLTQQVADWLKRIAQTPLSTQKEWNA